MIDARDDHEDGAPSPGLAGGEASGSAGSGEGVGEDSGDISSDTASFVSDDLTPSGEASEGAVELDLFGKPPPEGKRNWAHRRAEPRALALLWTVFLLLATVGTFVSAGTDGLMSVESYRYAARGLLTVIMVGATLLWPVVRLSQSLPSEGGVRGSAKDVFVVVFPAQAILWPQALLARWPIEVMAGSVALLTAWSVLVGAGLAWALGAREPGMRRLPARVATGWALAFVGLGLAGPGWWLVSSWMGGGVAASADGVRLSWMASPWTGQLELVRDRSWSGRSAWASSGHWWAIGGVMVVGLAGWVGAWMRGVGSRGAGSGNDGDGVVPGARAA
ncbi:MAG: hypothetical protein EA378_08720 [Phycisphaerales bacterium]|nr:MAG: hypothetical protein EA378_08720 [Phycisphaerales bacterium]